MTPFEKAMDDYYKQFGVFYPYAIGRGYPAKTDEENILIIHTCLREGKPLDFNPNYDSDHLY